eukprot:1143657-Pelagomonas_calceolata.AAC.1
MGMRSFLNPPLSKKQQQQQQQEQPADAESKCFGTAVHNQYNPPFFQQLRPSFCSSMHPGPFGETLSSLLVRDPFLNARAFEHDVLPLCKLCKLPLKLYAHYVQYAYKLASTRCALEKGYKGYKGVGLQPKNLADRLLVKLTQPASKIETNSDKKFETFTSLDLGKH